MSGRLRKMMPEIKLKNCLFQVLGSAVLAFGLFKSIPSQRLQKGELWALRCYLRVGLIYLLQSRPLSLMLYVIL